MNEFKFISKQPINKGWSSDKKFCVTDENGTRYLLRISSIDQFSTKESEFKIMKQIDSMGIPMCRPIEFGTCKEGVYSIQSWIEGRDAEEIITTLSDTGQYVYGLEAGRILKKIHSIPAPGGQENWESRFNRKIDRIIKGYTDCPEKFDGADVFIDYINSNRNLLKNRLQCFGHGDYHRGNMMIDSTCMLNIIDFGRYDFGDPWEDMKAITWDVQMSPLFASGRINGYFEGDVPIEFWKLLSFYICVGTLSSIAWAVPFGQGEINTMKTLAAHVLEWYDNMKNLEPSWYLKDFYIQLLDGVP